MLGCNLIPGFAIDSTCLDPDGGMPWDFDIAAKRDKAMHKVRTEKPAMIIGSVMLRGLVFLASLEQPQEGPRSSTT